MEERNTKQKGRLAEVKDGNHTTSVSEEEIDVFFSKLKAACSTNQRCKADKKAKPLWNKVQTAIKCDDKDEEYVPKAEELELGESDHGKSTTPDSSNETQTDEAPRKRRKYTFRKRKPATGKKKVHNYPRPKRYVCLIPGCGKAYTRPSLLEQHQRTHTGERPFVCQYPGCDQSFTRKDHLRRHQLKHLDEKDKPFHCSVCGKGVNSKQHLKRHEKTHYKSFHCDYPGCNEAFYKHQSLKAHQREVHDDGQLKCPKCDKTFSRPGRLNAHLKKHHKDKSRFVCEHPECLQSFKTWSALQVHIKSEHPKLECPVCGRKCVGPSGLKNHMKVHDEATAIKLWKCPLCNHKYLRKNELYDHFIGEHPDDKVPAFLQRDVKKETKSTGNSTKDAFMKVEDNRNGYQIDGQTDGGHKVLSPSEKDSKGINFPVSKYNGQTFTKAVKRKAIESSPMDLIINNVDNRLACEYVNCHRLFRREYDLQRHLEWHRKQDVKLEDKVKQLEAEKSS